LLLLLIRVSVISPITTNLAAFEGASEEDGCEDGEGDQEPPQLLLFHHIHLLLLQEEHGAERDPEGAIAGECTGGRRRKRRRS